MKIKKIHFPPPQQPSSVLLQQGPILDASNTATTTAWVIDDALGQNFLTMVNTFRESLPLDTKRPTVKRRFFSSAKQCPMIRQGLAQAMESAIGGGDGGAGTKLFLQSKESKYLPAVDNDSVGKKQALQIHVLSYMRFLEYDQVGGSLDPHTDGNKVCDETGLQSTHTMLLYLRDCVVGGETVLLRVVDKTNTRTTTTDTTTNGRRGGHSRVALVVEAVKPVVGRILLFPHPIWHEGRPTVDIPKLCLRAEVSLVVAARVKGTRQTA